MGVQDLRCAARLVEQFMAIKNLHTLWYQDIIFKLHSSW